MSSLSVMCYYLYWTRAPRQDLMYHVPKAKGSARNIISNCPMDNQPLPMILPTICSVAK